MHQPADDTTDRTLLRAAQAAIDRGDLGGADGLFLDHLALHRDDAEAHAAYGNFCLRTDRVDRACYLLYRAARLGAASADLLAELGHAQLETGNPKGARDSFEQALARDPAHAYAHYGIALCLLQEKAWTAAADAFAQAAVTQPGTPPILLNLAAALHKAGDDAGAAARYAEAEAIDPADPAMLLAYGTFLRETGQPAQGLRRLERCAREHPGEPLVLLEIARCLRATGDATRALGVLDALERLAPGMPEQQEERGNCLASAGSPEARDAQWGLAVGSWLDAQAFDLAEPLLVRMLATNPANAGAWNAKGLFHDAQQQLEPAEAAFLEAIRIDPDLLPPYVNLGNLYEASNRLDEAFALAERALALPSILVVPPSPALPSLHVLCAKLARRRKDYATAEAHLDAATAAAGPDTDLQTPLFERARLRDLRDDTDGAIALFDRANAIAKLEPDAIGPHGNKFLRGVDYMIDLVAKGWMGTWRKPAADPPGPAPAFLVGFPRSGTTLLNTVLYSHSAIQVIEERQTIAKIIGAVRHMPEGYPEAMPACDAIDVAFMRDAYWRAAVEHVALDPAKLLVDKFPMHLATAGLMHLAFPRAKFLFALRHPCDAVLSCFMQNFKLNSAMANFRTLGDTVTLYAKIMQLWQAYRDALPLHVHTIRYEDVVDDFDGQVQALCGFLEVPWEEGLRQFATRALDRGRINTPSYEQVSKPIYREARYRWERYRQHFEPFLPTLQPWIERFGYAPPSPATG